MTKRWCMWLGLSLGLNMLLALVCWQLWSISKAEVALPAPVPEPTSRLAPPPVAIEAPVARDVVEAGTAAQISWSDLASSDFFDYRDNLLAIGCPERTVRDILESELDQWFLERRRPILEVVQRNFWDMAARGGRNGFDDVVTELDELSQERSELLLAVLGEREPDRDLDLGWRQEHFVQRHHWLPDNIQARLFELDEKYEQARRAWAGEIRARADPQLTAEDLLWQEQLQAEYEANRLAALGDLADEFEFRDSRRAHWAGGLVGFEPTEDEWRAVTQQALSSTRNFGERAPRKSSIS